MSGEAKQIYNILKKLAILVPWMAVDDDDDDILSMSSREKTRTMGPINGYKALSQLCRWGIRLKMVG